MTEEHWPSSIRAWSMTLALTFAYTIAFLHRIALSLFVEPLQRDFGLTDTEIGILTGVCFAVPYTLCAPLAGWLIDKWDRRRLVAAGALLWSASTALPVFSYFSILMGRMATGIGQSVVQPGSASLIADVFPPEKRARGYGVFVAGTAFGTACAYIAGALAVVFGQHWAGAGGLRDWQLALMALGTLGLLVPPVVLFNPEPVRRERIASAAHRQHVFQFLRQRGWVFATLFGGVTLTFLAPYGQLAFMPSLFIRKYGWTAADMAFRFGIIAAVVGALGSLSAGWLVAWFARRGVRHASWLTCLIGGLACLVPGALAPLMPTGMLSLAVFGFSGMFANWSAVAVLTAISEVTPNEFRGQVTALYTACVGLFSAALGPLVVGVLNDHLPGSRLTIGRSLSLTFAGCAVGAAVMLTVGLPAYKRLRRQAPTVV